MANRMTTTGYDPHHLIHGANNIIGPGFDHADAKAIRDHYFDALDANAPHGTMSAVRDGVLVYDDTVHTAASATAAFTAMVEGDTVSLTDTVDTHEALLLDA